MTDSDAADDFDEQPPHKEDPLVLERLRNDGEQVLAEVLASNPDDRISWRALPEVYRNLGRGFESIGNMEEAKAAFDMAAVSERIFERGP